MDVHFFPQNAFLPATGFRQKLSQLFNMRAYNADDVRSIRTSVYYSNFETYDSKLRYVIATGHALRQGDGRFVVYTSKSQITEDPIRKTIQINAGYDRNQADKTILCSQHDVLPQLRAVEKALNKHAAYGLAFPPASILRLCDDLHINAAILLFNRACTRDDIIQQQKTTRYNNDRPILS